MAGFFAEYNTPGSYTLMIPKGVHRLKVRLWGAGGQGGPGHFEGFSGYVSSGAGGAGGVYVETEIDVEPESEIDVFVGAGGADSVVDDVGNPGEPSWVVSPTQAYAAGGLGGRASTFGHIVTGTSGHGNGESHGHCIERAGEGGGPELVQTFLVSYTVLDLGGGGGSSSASRATGIDGEDGAGGVGGAGGEGLVGRQQGSGGDGASSPGGVPGAGEWPGGGGGGGFIHAVFGGGQVLCAGAPGADGRAILQRVQSPVEYITPIAKRFRDAGTERIAQKWAEALTRRLLSRMRAGWDRILLSPDTFELYYAEHGRTVNGRLRRHGEGFNASSHSSVTIGLGVQTFEIEAGKDFVHLLRVTISRPGMKGFRMEGAVVSYTGTTLVVNVDYIQGSGTYDSWIIHLGGYHNFLKVGKRTKRGINTDESSDLWNANRSGSLDKLRLAVSLIFDHDARRFREDIVAAELRYAIGEAFPLSATGWYTENVLGGAVRQCFFLGESDKFEGFRWPSDTLKGDYPPVEHFIEEGLRAEVRALLEQQLVRGIVWGLRGFNLGAVHAYLDELLRTYLTDAWSPPPDSYIRVEGSGGSVVVHAYLQPWTCDD